jgi:hypothetical protein
LSASVRAAVDGRYVFSAKAIGVETLQWLPLGVGAMVVAAAAFDVYASGAAISFKDGLAVAALAVALQQPYASVTSGTPRPLLMIPLEVAFIAAALIVVERLFEAVPASGRLTE